MSTAELLNRRISPKFTEDVLLQILRKKSGCGEVVIRNIKFGPEAKKGDSYLSTVTKFSVDAKGKCESSVEEKDFQVHVITKSFPDNIARRKTFRSVDFFGNEIAFYEKVWPALQKFQNSKNPKISFDCIPICLAAFSDGINDYIALEDVTFQGYETLGRGSGLNFDQAKVILQLFAKFHALCLAFKDQHPTEFEKVADTLSETYYAEKFREWYAGSFAKFRNVLHDAVEQDLPPEYLEKLEKFLDQDLYGEITKICATRGPLAVITHGDCWAPNFLVKQNKDDEIVDTMMIDFQLTRCSSLSMDIMFFLNTCLNHQTVTEGWDALIDDYQQTFVARLEELGSSRNLLTAEMIREDMKKCGNFGFGMSMEAIIMSLMEDEDVADIDMIEGENAVPLDTVWVIRPIKNKEKRQRVANFFKNLVDKNII